MIKEYEILREDFRKCASTIPIDYEQLKKMIDMGIELNEKPNTEGETLVGDIIFSCINDYEERQFNLRFGEMQYAEEYVEVYNNNREELKNIKNYAGKNAYELLVFFMDNGFDPCMYDGIAGTSVVASLVYQRNSYTEKIINLLFETSFHPGRVDGDTLSGLYAFEYYYWTYEVPDSEEVEAYDRLYKMLKAYEEKHNVYSE